MKITLYLIFLLSALALSPAISADDEPEPSPDIIVLQNGSRILGTVTGARDSVVRVDTEFAGELSIEFEHIASIKTNQPVPLQLQDRTVIEPQELRLEGEQFAVSRADGTERNYALDELRVLNPEPWELGEGYGWTGRMSFATSMQRGNTEVDELDYLLDSKWRSDKDRYTLQMLANIVETNGVENTNNWTVIGKYDYFLSDISYWGVNAYAQHDEFADIDLRWYAGPYLGRDLFTKPIFSMSAEVGASYVSEDRVVAEDQEYLAANWSLDMSSNYLGGESRMYFRQIGIWNLEETSDVVINTWTGISFPLLWSLEAAVEVVLNYNSGVQGDTEKLDETYRVRLGYTW